MKNFYRGTKVSIIFAVLIFANLVAGAERKFEAFEAQVLHSGSLPGYWLERCLTAEHSDLLLGFAANPEKLASFEPTRPNSSSVGRLVILRNAQSGWVATPAGPMAYRVQDLAICKDTVITVGLEPVTASLNAVILFGRRKGETQALWKHKLRTEALEPYRATAVALSEGELLVVVNARPVGASAAQARGDVALLTKMTSTGSELWQRQIISDGAVFVNHVGFEAGEVRITGSSRGQTFERWSGLNPQMARNWGFEAGFSSDAGQATKFSQVVATESVSVRKAVRMPGSGTTLMGGNFSGTLAGVMPALPSVGKGATAFLLTSSGSGERLHSLLTPIGEERLADLVVADNRCYALLLQIQTGVPGLGPPKLSSRRLILRGYSADGKTVGERELANSQSGWFKGSLTLVEHEKGLVVAFNSEAQCQVLGKSFLMSPMAEMFFVVKIPAFE